MRATSATAPRRFPFPPFWLLLAVVLMVALDRWVPSWTVERPSVRHAGMALVLLGLATILGCAWLFRRAGTTIKPFERSTAFVVKGPYRVTRNPIYLAMALTLVGVGLWLGSLVPFAVIPPFVALLDRRFIRREEAMMSEAFGADYDEYCRRVRRWI